MLMPGIIIRPSSSGNGLMVGRGALLQSLRREVQNVFPVQEQEYAVIGL